MAEPVETGDVAGLLARRVAERPDAPLLVDADTGETLSYAAAAAQAGRWAAWYAAQGLAPGDRVAVVLPNGPTFACLYLGAAIAGLTLAPYHAGLTAPELAGLVAAHGSRLALVPAARQAELAHALGVPVVTVGPRGALPAGLPPAPAHPAPGELPNGLPPAPIPPTPGGWADQPLVLVMTSGTSGGAKAVVLTQGNLVWTSAAACRAWGRGPADVYLTPLPLHHINAQVVGLLTALQGGGAVALGSRLPPAKLWAACERVGATGLSLVPALVHELLARDGAPPAGLRYAVCSSAALPAGARDAFERRFGIPLLFCYGLSEAGCFVTYSQLAPVSPPGAVGRAFGCEVQLSAEGEIRVRGRGLMRGYDQDAAATAHAIRDGWLHTGDVGRLDADGFLWVEGRLKDMINRGGEKVAPDAVEAVIRGCPGVAAVAVYGVPDERLGEEVHAAVVAAPGSGLAADALDEWCAERLAEFAAPKAWRFLDELPRGPTGKVLRRLLRG